MKTRLLIAAVLLASIPGMARADTAGVHVQISAGVHLPTRAAGSCEVQVPAGSNGMAVLDAAVAATCLDGYDFVMFDSGPFVTCVTPRGGPEVCQIGDGLVTYWNVFVNDVSSPVGIGQVSVQPGDELELTYTTANCWVQAC